MFIISTRLQVDLSQYYWSTDWFLETLGNCRKCSINSHKLLLREVWLFYSPLACPQGHYYVTVWLNTK